MSQTTNKGDVAELILATELVSRGINVAFPFGSNQLFDLIAERPDNGKLLKIQIKTRSNPESPNTYRFQNLTKYVGKVDILAFLVNNDWYFWTNLKLKRYGQTNNVILKTQHNVKNNWKVFGV